MLRLAPDLELPDRFATEGVAVMGMRGSGKTNTERRWCEVLYDVGVPFVVIEPKGDWGGIRSSADGKKPGLSVPVFGGLDGDFPLTDTMGAQIADLLVDQNLSAVLDVSLLSHAARGRFLTEFADRLMHRHRQSPHVRCVVLEEAHRYVPQQIPPELRRAKEAVSAILLEGRAFGLGCWVCTQRPARLHKDVLEEVGTVICHRIGAAASNDLKTVKGWVQHEELGPEITPTLTKLGPGEAWVLSPEFDLLARVQIDRMRTYDSGATPLVGAGARKAIKLADVDTTAIKEALQESIEKAKADDPVELRKQMADLRRTIARLEARTPDTIVEQVEVRVPFIPPDALKAVELVGDLARKIVTASEEFTAEAGKLPELPAVSSPPGSRWKAPTPPADHQQTGEKTGRAPALRRTADRPADTDLPIGEHRVLTAIAQHRDGVVAEQLTVLTGYKRSSRNTYVQRLRSRGYVDTTGGHIVATDAGVAALGDFEPLPTGTALQDYWLDRLPEGERRILSILVDARGDDVQFETIDEATGYKRSSRNTYLQRLRARQLVTTDTGSARAADLLFEEAR